MEVFIEYSVDPQVPVGAEHKGSKAKLTESKNILNGLHEECCLGAPRR